MTTEIRNLDQARQQIANYGGAATFLAAEAFHATAPEWCKIDCRGCWKTIKGGEQITDNGIAIFHTVCWNAMCNLARSMQTDTDR